MADEKVEAKVSKGVDIFGDEFAESQVPATETEETEDQVDDASAVLPGVRTAPATSVSKFQREIDLGDGSGKQVFKGNTAEELLDVLTESPTSRTLDSRGTLTGGGRDEQARNDWFEDLGPTYRPETGYIGTASREVAAHPDVNPRRPDAAGKCDGPARHNSAQ
jgi:hypothetical protein